MGRVLRADRSSTAPRLARVNSRKFSRVLVTGASGFVGQYVGAWSESMPTDERVDLRDASAVAATVATLYPDAVVHLAAQSFVPQAMRDPRETFAVNFEGTLNLLIALRDSGFTGRFLHVGSGDMYGRVAVEQMPVREDYPLRPRNPYAVSKVAAEALCYQWSQSEKFEIVMARPFNHVGPFQSPRFVVAGLARQIAEIRLGKRPPVVDVGNVDVTRDFTDVRDVVAAYRLLLEQGRNGEAYNVCSGVERSVRTILDSLAKLAGVSVQIRQDVERLRTAEQERVWGSCEKLSRDTGWSVRIAFDQTLRDTLNYWEEQLR